MKPETNPHNVPTDSDYLNALDAEAESDAEISEPETLNGIVEISAWNQSADAVTELMPILPVENEETITEQLVNEGNEEADFEQREAAADVDEE